MTLDDVYGPDHDRFPLEQETPGRAAVALDWEESDAELTAAIILRRYSSRFISIG